MNTDPLYQLTLGQEDLGHIAVCGFFALSGCLVTASWFSSDSWFSYFRKRILRIYPGFIVAWLVCAFVVLPLSGVAWADFLAMVKPAYWGLKIALLRGFGGLQAFPGNPQQSLNTSLWSIPLEFECYVLVAVLAWLKVLRSRSALLTLTAMVGVVLVAVPDLDFIARALAPVGGGPSRSVDARASLLTLPHFYFLLGMLVYQFRNELRYSAPLAAAALVTLLVSARLPPLLRVAMPFCWTYLLFYLAYLPKLHLPLVGPNLDLSYGLYLYGWPIQQLLVKWAEPHLSQLTLFAVTLPLAALSAYLSWTFVERPAQRFNRAREPVPATATSGPGL